MRLRDLTVFVGPGVAHLNDLVLPGKRIFESFFARGALGSIERVKIYPASKVSGVQAAGRERKESLQLRLWNLNICIEKDDAKC